jgi:hypothetical protein
MRAKRIPTASPAGGRPDPNRSFGIFAGGAGTGPSVMGPVEIDDWNYGISVMATAP